MNQQRLGQWGVLIQRPLRCLFQRFETESKVFNYRVCEDFAGDALDFGVGGVGREAIFKSQKEIFALADVFHACVLHAAEGIGDGLALGVEDCSLESDIDMSLHRV